MCAAHCMLTASVSRCHPQQWSERLVVVLQVAPAPMIGIPTRMARRIYRPPGTVSAMARYVQGATAQAIADRPCYWHQPHLAMVLDYHQTVCWPHSPLRVQPCILLGESWYSIAVELPAVRAVSCRCQRLCSCTCPVYDSLGLGGHYESLMGFCCDCRFPRELERPARACTGWPLKACNRQN